MGKKDESNLWGIVIEGPAPYSRMVAEILRGTAAAPGGVFANPVGKVILEAIAGRPHQLTITRSTMMCNAGTQTEGNEDDAHPKGEIYYLGNEDDRRTLQNERFDQSTTKGTGKGVAVAVQFSPGVSSCSGGAVTFDPELVLFHELVHALRKMQGLENSTPLDGSPIRHFGDTEEWLALLVENVYRSAKGVKEFRGAWDATTKLKPPENTPEGFLDNNAHRSLLRQYPRTWKPTFAELSKVVTHFNPFRTYALDPAKFSKPPEGYDPQREWYDTWG